MSSSETSPRRRRGSKLEQALLAATWEELKHVGYRNLSFENVARRAGTSKSVVYRRWANRLDLVRATLRAYRPLLSGPIPDTGALRTDIIMLLEHMAEVMSEVPDIVWGMAVDAISDAQLHESFPREITESNLRVMRAVLQKAEARGEIMIGTTSDRIITLPIDLARHEMLVKGRAPTKDSIKQIVDEIFLPLVVMKGS